MGKRSINANNYSRGQEIARDSFGNEIGRYSVGDTTKIHVTDGSSGWGKTTLHPDGRNHHWGSHSPLSYPIFNDGGKYSKK